MAISLVIGSRLATPRTPSVPNNYGIAFHRNLRSKGTFKNELEQIKGIGKATTDLLLKKFRSIKVIREKSLEEIAQVIGNAKATLVTEYFRGKQ